MATPLRTLGMITLRMEICRLMLPIQNDATASKMNPMAIKIRFRTLPTRRPTMKFITKAPTPRGLSVRPLWRAE